MLELGSEHRFSSCLAATLSRVFLSLGVKSQGVKRGTAGVQPPLVRLSHQGNCAGYRGLCVYNLSTGAIHGFGKTGSGAHGFLDQSNWPTSTMTIRGGCQCNNIEFVWHTVDHSLVPRACQCSYCIAKGAAYVSKSGTRVEVTIRKKNLHRTHQQGSNTADFHECQFCGDLVLVTTRIEGELYGAVNAGCVGNPAVFGAPVKMELFDQPASEKITRWRQNWCNAEIAL